MRGATSRDPWPCLLFFSRLSDPSPGSLAWPNGRINLWRGRWIGRAKKRSRGTRQKATSVSPTYIFFFQGKIKYPERVKFSSHLRLKANYGNSNFAIAKKKRRNVPEGLARPALHQSPMPRSHAHAHALSRAPFDFFSGTPQSALVLPPLSISLSLTPSFSHSKDHDTSLAFFALLQKNCETLNWRDLF